MASQALATKAPLFSGALGSPMPNATATNDLAYWDQGEKTWKKLAAPATTGTFVLGVKDGTLQWLETQDC